jgi:hypothetical protein
VFVVGTVMLGGYSLTSFGPDQAAAFKLGAGRALGTNVSVVGVTSGTVPLRRRKMLQEESLNVTFSVQTPPARADAVAASMRTAITPAVMQAAGLVRCMRVELVGAPRSMAFALADVASLLAQPAEEDSDNAVDDEAHGAAVAGGISACVFLVVLVGVIWVASSQRQTQDAARIRDLRLSLELANSYPVPAAPANRAADLRAEAWRPPPPPPPRPPPPPPPVVAQNPCVLCPPRSAASPLVMNLPCRHALLCRGCTVAFREHNGQICNQCRAPSTLAAPLHTATCGICFCDLTNTAAMFGFQPCGHVFCVGCITLLVRSALGNAQEKFPFRCEACREDARSAGRPQPAPLPIVDLMRRLPALHAEVSAAGQQPLTAAELDRFRRMNEVYSVPANQRVHCPRPDCVGTMTVEADACVLARARGGVRISCPECATVFCMGCRSAPWHEGRTCQDQERVHAGTDAATARLVQQTTKPCPHCGFRITHYRGHACHHIVPGRGCPQYGTHWCYCCGERRSASQRCERGCSTFCDDTCSCPDCPVCRPGRPCTGAAGCCNDGRCRVCQPRV